MIAHVLSLDFASGGSFVNVIAEGFLHNREVRPKDFVHIFAGARKPGLMIQTQISPSQNTSRGEGGFPSSQGMRQDKCQKLECDCY